MSSIDSLLNNSSDPNFLRETARSINRENERLNREVSDLWDLLEQVREQKEFEGKEFEKQVKRLHRNQFKKGRETIGDRERKEKEDEVLLHAQSLCGEKPKNEVWKVALDEGKACHDADSKTVFDLAKNQDPALLESACEIAEIENFTENSMELTVVERRYKKVIHKRVKYRVTNTATGHEVIVTAPGPMKLFPQCRYSLDFAVSVAADKFLDHLPYERQRRRMKRKGLDVSVKTLSRLTEMVALHCDRVIPEILTEVFEANLAVHIDETPWPTLSEKDSNGYMWVLSNQAGSCYFFEPTRSGAVPQEHLKSYQGSVLTDGYKGYLFLRKKEGVIWGCCWAHIRRKFYDLREDFPEDTEYILNLIDDLFQIERDANSWDVLKALRLEKSTPIVSSIEEWLIKKRSEYFPQSGMREAIDYGLNYWQEFKSFLKDITLPLSNNDAERAIRQSVMGRKNFHGSKTINGADTAASLYTVIESCKKAQLDPEDYLKYLITENNSKRKPLTPLELAKKQNQ